MQQLTATQLMEWEAFNRLSPIGGQRWDFYFAYLLSSIHNLAIAIHGKKGAKQLSIEEFVPNWSGDTKQEEAMSVDQMKKFFQDFAKIHNSSIRQQQKQDSRKPKTDKK